MILKGLSFYQMKLLSKVYVFSIPDCKLSNRKQFTTLYSYAIRKSASVLESRSSNP